MMAPFASLLAFISYAMALDINTNRFRYFESNMTLQVGKINMGSAAVKEHKVTAICYKGVLDKPGLRGGHTTNKYAMRAACGGACESEGSAGFSYYTDGKDYNECRCGKSGKTFSELMADPAMPPMEAAYGGACTADDVQQFGWCTCETNKPLPSRFPKVGKSVQTTVDKWAKAFFTQDATAIMECYAASSVMNFYNVADGTRTIYSGKIRIEAGMKEFWKRLFRPCYQQGDFQTKVFSLREAEGSHLGNVFSLFEAPASGFKFSSSTLIMDSNAEVAEEICIFDYTPKPCA